MGSLPGLFYENPGSLETARFTVAGMVLKLDNPRPWLWVLQRRRSGWRPTLGCRLPIWLMARGCWRDENWSKSCTKGTVRWCRYMIGTFFLQSPWIGRRISYLNRRNQSLHTWRADNPHRPFCFPLQLCSPRENWLSQFIRVCLFAIDLLPLVWMEAWPLWYFSQQYILGLCRGWDPSNMSWSHGTAVEKGLQS